MIKPILIILTILLLFTTGCIEKEKDYNELKVSGGIGSNYTFKHYENGILIKEYEEKNE